METLQADTYDVVWEAGMILTEIKAERIQSPYLQCYIEEMIRKDFTQKSSWIFKNELDCALESYYDGLKIEKKTSDRP